MPRTSSTSRDQATFMDESADPIRPGRVRMDPEGTNNRISGLTSNDRGSDPAGPWPFPSSTA